MKENSCIILFQLGMDRRMNFGRRPLMWYRIRQKIEFDDSLHQVRIFQDEDLAPQLLLLAYQPHLRYFLHRHDVLEVGYTAIFDLIQGITDEEMKNLQVTDLEWPEGSTFVHTPFAIVVQCQHKRYAEIEFGSEGFIGMIRYYKDEQIIREDIYDDRGFISSSLYYEGGQQAIETILMPGVWQLCHFFDGRGIVANPRTEGRFNKSYYGDLSEVIWEFLTKFLEEKVEAEDRFVIASDSRHNKHLFDHLPAANTKILTWFAERNQDDSIDTYGAFLPQVDLLIADRYDYLEQLQVAYPEEAKKLKHMASFDTFGFGNQSTCQRV
ncbi:MAG: accessory Sec system protein Asp1 [Streptococcus sp.]